MKPVDRRLLSYARGARAFFVSGALLALVQVACIIAFACLVSSIVVAAIAGAPLASLTSQLVALVAVVLVRSVTVWAMELVAARGAAVVKSELRQQVFRALVRLGPAWLSSRNSVAVSTTATTGLDALDGYFAKYLPQLILTALATPVLVLVLFWQDLLSGLTVALTLPLIPVFMILIGWATQKAQQEQWQGLSRLSSGFLDVVEGLSTLKVFGREKRQVARVRATTEAYRVSTMKVLRMSFISGFALELAASLSVALVAVSIGLRLVSGDLGLGVGLFVLLLVPEAFLPLRQVGAQFHASAEGVAATAEVFEVLDAAAAVEVRAGAAGVGVGVGAGAVAAAAAPGRSLLVDSLSVSYGEHTVLSDFSARFEPATLAVIVGASGAGKSSAIAALLGFAPHTGSAAFDDERPVTLESIAWAGQKPGLMTGTIAENVALGSTDPSPSAELVARALDLAGASGFDSTKALGVNGAGLSGGQAQRVAVARAFYRAIERGCSVVVLDEPSSALDAASEGRMLAGIHHLKSKGRIVIVVSHRPGFRAAADQVIELDAGRVVSPVRVPAEAR